MMRTTKTEPPARKDPHMKRRMFTSAGAAAILATVLIATPAGVSAQQGQFQGGDGGQEDTSTNVCLAPNLNAGAGAASSSSLSKTGAFRRRPIPSGVQHGALAFARTELFFGTDKPEGPVTDEEFGAFLDNQSHRAFRTA
jgi:hypothetical protein